MERVKGRRAFSVGAVIGRTLSVWLRNIVPFTLLALIVESPLFIYTAVVLQGGLTDDEYQAWDLATTWGPQFLNPIVAGLIAYGVFQQLNDKSVGVLECLGKGLRQLLPVLLTGIVVGALIAIGTAAFVIPGIIFACMWWVAVPVAVVERAGVFKAMRRSNELTKGEKGNVFVILLVLGLFGFLVGLALGLGFVGGENTPAFMWGLMVVMLVFSVLQSVAAAVGYHDLRISKEGASVDELVSVFD
jgi:hypothetical protein